jgi:abhydrolase domain-containing protein 11
MQFLTRGLASAALRPPKAIETAVGTAVTLNKTQIRKQSYCTPPPSHAASSNNDTNYDNTKGTSNFKPVNLAYRALECRGKERDKQTKTPLIIHHSLYGRKENWNPISEIINRITQRKIINVDARNHGESPHTKDMSLPLMSKDIIHLIKQLKNGSDKFSFLGHSMGGRIGILLALMQPQLVDKLVVVDSSVVVNENSRRRWSHLRQACSSLMKIEHRLKLEQGYERLKIANKAVENIIVDKTDRANFLSNLILSDQPNQESIWRVNMTAYLSHPDMMLQVPTFDDACFKGETLFINGDRSRFASREDEADILRLFPNAEFAWLEDCGHLLLH